MKKTVTSNNALRIAIVGGGIAGLSSAYYLMRRAREKGVPLDIQLFEGKSTLGGNADTVTVDLGCSQKAGQEGVPFHRWADLGVNDVNLAAYTMMKEMMRDIGYLENMRLLQDTACFYDPNSSFAITNDEYLNGVSDPRFNIAHIDGGLFYQLIRIVHETALNCIKPQNADYTCGHYFQDCIDNPYEMLSWAARELKIEIAWDAPELPELLIRIRDHYYYPRISAMYFTDPRGPAVMPLMAPFEYYKFQEGDPHKVQERCYFDGGSQEWLHALKDYLLDRKDPEVLLTIRTNKMARVKVSVNGVTIESDGVNEAVDLCIMANHADDALKALDFADTTSDFYTHLKGTLETVRYTYSYAVCHTDARIMPKNRNLWRTYNIPIRSPGDSIFPYRIDYVVNLHQNDPDNPRFDHAGMPVYFVSLVDDLNRIPRQEILDRLDLKGGLPDSKPSSAAIETGYRHQVNDHAPELNTKAWTVFKHNILDAGCIQAQANISAINKSWAGERKMAASDKGSKGQPALLFAGGWTVGAGLHEQCLMQSESISAFVLPD